MILPLTNGPRSVMRTSTCFLFVEIGHLDPGFEGKRAMRGGELFHVVNFSVGGAASVVRDSVPARDSGFGFADARGLHGRGNMRAKFFARNR